MLEQLRIAFSLSDVIEEIGALREKAELESNSELFRNSLRLYSWLLDRETAGYKITVSKDGIEHKVEIKQLQADVDGKVKRIC